MSPSPQPSSRNVSARTRRPAPRPHATRQRAAITAVLAAARGPLSAEEVWTAARQQQRRLGLRTVFRNLQEAVAAGALVRVEFPGQPPRYERPATNHHPHFVCFGCDGVFDLPGETPDVRSLCALPPGFEATGEEVTIFGRCATCVQGAAAPAPARRAAVPAGKRPRSARK